MGKNLFDDITGNATTDSQKSQGHLKAPISKKGKEDAPLDRLRNLDESIAAAIEKIKALKETKKVLNQRIKDLETQLNEKNMELERTSTEKIAIKGQITDLLNELEKLDLE